MAVRFDGQVVIITGAGRGLGRAYALECARRGARVVVNDLGVDLEGANPSAGPADDVVAEIMDGGGEAVASYASVADAGAGEAICNLAMDRYGRIDALINNAAVQKAAPFEDLTPEDIDSVFDIQIKGCFNVSQAAYRIMKERGYGRIVMTSSTSGVFGSFDRTAYAAAKTAAIGMMNGIALEGEAHGILCNSILPVAQTRLSGKLAPELAARLAPITDPLKGRDEPESVAPMVAFLASDSCKITKTAFSAAAGRFARVILGVTDGWAGPFERVASADEIAAHIDEIMDTGVYHMPDSTLDELKIVSALWVERSRDRAGEAAVSGTASDEGR